MRFEHRKLSSGGAVYTHYLQAGGQTVGLYESTAITGGTPGAKGFKYLHRDHLGSVDTVTHFDSTLYATAVLARYSYDLWGKRRNADWTDASAPIVANETIRGYTGHEMLDTVGLVHMNGRVYDAELGRMLSADPFVPEAVNPQAFNRYSYVLNNPLSYTDPSGFFFKKLVKAVVKVFKKVFKFIASIPIIRKLAPFVVASFCGPAAAACAAAVAGGLEAASGGSIFDIMTAAYSAASGVHSDFGLQDAIRAEFTGLDGGGGDGESVKEKVSRVSAGARTWVLGAFKSANGAVTGAFDFAIGLIPFVNATRELLQGNLRGALIEAGIDVAIIGVGAVTFGVGAVALKGLRGARVVTRGGGKALDFGRDNRKLDFLFNRNIDPSKAANVARASGNANRIGIADTPANRSEVMRRFNEAFNNPNSIVGPGHTAGSNLREFFLPGVTGTGSKVQFVERNGQVITIIAK